jgi:hypothetical protein
VIVGPVGTDAENGAALLAALASMTTASEADPWLLCGSRGFTCFPSEARV